MKRYSFALVVLSVISVTACIGANLISGRLGFFGAWVAPMGVFFFPLIYVISDVISDVYGYRISRWVAWITLFANLLFVFGMLAVINAVPVAPFAIDVENALLLLLIGSSGTSGMVRIIIAGIIGAVLGGWVNDIVFQMFRTKDGIDKFIKRKLLSSIAAEAVDTGIFITIAFIGSPAWGLSMYIVQFLLKYGVECITAPIAKKIAKKIRAIEGTDIFEDRNKFNIFGFYKK